MNSDQDTLTRFETMFMDRSWDRWVYEALHFSELKSIGIPCRYGVYVIRGPSKIPRVRGSSNVVYIGQSGARRGLQGIGPGNGRPGRLFNTRGPDKIVRELIEGMFRGQTFTLECSFEDQVNPRTIEGELLFAYLQDHYELPPANHSADHHGETFIND